MAYDLFSKKMVSGDCSMGCGLPPTRATSSSGSELQRRPQPTRKPTVGAFVGAALKRGVSGAAICGALRKKGLSGSQISSAFDQALGG